MTSYDAVVVGAGVNGLVAANLLADRGWSVLVLESQPEVGGAVRTDTEVHPGFRHDTFSAFYPLAAASPVLRGLELERHGLRWRHAPAVLGHPTPDGRWAILSRDRALTAHLMEQQSPGDGAAWLELCEVWDHVGDHLIGGLTRPFPPLRDAPGLLRGIARTGGLDLVRQLLMPVLDLADVRFTGFAPQLLLAGNAGHADIPANAPGSGLFGLIMTMLGQTVGFPVPEGGAGELAGALERRFRARGGTLHCSAEVERVEVSGRRAVGVRTVAGERYAARHAVLADVSAPLLYGRLLRPEDVPRRTVRSMRSFRLDPSTVKVDWALSGPVPWAAEPPVAPGTVHVASTLEELAVAQAQISTGVVPAHPFLLAGQMTTSDPTRSPAGTESLWAYTHVPQRTERDAGDGSVRGFWDRDDCERFGDRVQARLEELAPGFGERILARRVLGPREFEARDASLVGGAINAGTAQLFQELIFRPVPGTGRPRTQVAGLYLASASAHPGGGVHGSPGANAARAVLASRRLRRG
ncbi:phytoene desaturase family protein [Nocardioides sp.]|uniref:phytoene desaturase family protein n=1 Tax=Nocardioides sp. TaxID=35761 RepID=UPI0037831B79